LPRQSWIGGTPGGLIRLSNRSAFGEARLAQKWEGATGSLAIVAPGRGPLAPRSTATDRDCRRFAVESRKSMFRTLHPVACSATRKEKPRRVRAGL
jgi:hypothetical protein